MSIGTFTLIKNEVGWVGFNIMSLVGFVDEFVYFDGNSTDGTLELLEYIKKKYQVNIKIFKDQDCKDLQDDYVKVFNDCLGQVTTDYAWFCHPDMIATELPNRLFKGPLAYYVNLKSFAGEPFETTLEIPQGRTDKWKSIMINKLGIHYFGHYGATNEDIYLKDVTGDEHIMYQDFKSYPFEIRDSGIHMNHYSDVRPYARRLGRMVSCLKNQIPGTSEELILEMAKTHPRVTLAGDSNFVFKPVTDVPRVILNHYEEFASVVGKKPEEFCPIKLPEVVSA